MAYTRHGHHIKGTVLEDRPIGLLTARCGGPLVCKECWTDFVNVSNDVSSTAALVPNPDVHIPPEIKQDYNNDYNAITKVYDALVRAGLTGPQIVAALNEIYNAGVIIRERKG